MTRFSRQFSSRTAWTIKHNVRVLHNFASPLCQDRTESGWWWIVYGLLQGRLIHPCTSAPACFPPTVARTELLPDSHTHHRSSDTLQRCSDSPMNLTRTHRHGTAIKHQKLSMAQSTRTNLSQALLTGHCSSTKCSRCMFMVSIQNWH